MKLAITQILLGILLIATVTFFMVALLPGLTHYDLPSEDPNIRRSIEATPSPFVFIWILFSYLVSGSVMFCGVLQLVQRHRL